MGRVGLFLSCTGPVWALFNFKKIYKMNVIALTFVFDKYYLIID